MDYHGHSGIEVHGQDGIGHLYLPTPPNTHLIRRDKTAVEFIIETCKANPGQITLITLGPLTNVAQALVQCPELPRYVKRIGTIIIACACVRACAVVRVCVRVLIGERVVTMGGVLNEPGNKSPVAEANFHKYDTNAPHTHTPPHTTAHAHMCGWLIGVIAFAAMPSRRSWCSTPGSI
jgi:hypothetical protein